MSAAASNQFRKRRESSRTNLRRNFSSPSRKERMPIKQADTVFSGAGSANASGASRRRLSPRGRVKTSNKLHHNDDNDDDDDDNGGAEKKSGGGGGAAGRGKKRSGPDVRGRTVMDTNINSIISADLVTMKWKVPQMTRALFMRSQALSPTTTK